MADNEIVETDVGMKMSFNTNVSKFIYTLARELADTQALTTTIKKGFVAEGSPSAHFYAGYINELFEPETITQFIATEKVSGTTKEVRINRYKTIPDYIPNSTPSIVSQTTTDEDGKEKIEVTIKNVDALTGLLKLSDTYGYVIEDSFSQNDVGILPD